MSNVIPLLTFPVLIGVILLGIEMILTFGLDFFDSPQVNKWIRISGKVVIWGCVITWMFILSICAVAAFDLFRQGQTEDAVKLVISTLLAAVGIYVLFIRYYMKKLKKYK